MSYDTPSLPTVISTATIMNALVRGAEKATEKLGDDYFAVVRYEYSNRIISVYKSYSNDSSDTLSPTQEAIAPQRSVWSMKVSEHDVRYRDNEFFKKNPPLYFFLQRKAALDYVNVLEGMIVEAVLKAAGKTTDKES